MQNPSIQPAAPSPIERLASLDAYRGFVILIMLWVNFIGEMPAIPSWLKHAKADQDTFTFPDLVFPGFLFMAGIAIPLSLYRTAQHSAPLMPALRRIFWRAFSLIVAGVMMVNEYRYDAAATLLSTELYYALFYLAIILIWMQGNKNRVRFWFGIALMATLMLLFKGTPDADFHSVHLENSWWGILGIIGWAYLCCSLVYLAARGSSAVLMGALVFMIALYIGEHEGLLTLSPHWIDGPLGIGQMFGSISANVLAGTLVGNLFVNTRIDTASSPQAQRAIHLQRLRFMFLFAAGMVLAGVLLRHWHPINKIQATETYTLVCAGINLFAFMLFYGLIEVLHQRAWAALLISAGANALFVYILPDLWNQIVRLAGLDHQWWTYAWPWLEQGGAYGLLNAVAITLFMFALAMLGSRTGLRLKF